MIGWVVGVPMLVILLVGIILRHEQEGEGIPRTLAVKSVVLALQSPEELSQWQKTYKASHFPAKYLDEWYVPYMDYLYENGFLSEEDTPATEESASGKLTYGEAAQIAGALSPELGKKISVTKKNREKPYPEDLWWLFYDSLLRLPEMEGKVERGNICIYGTIDNVPNTPSWVAHTNRGEMGFAGLALDAYIDHELEVYIRGDEILHVLGDKGQEVTYRNV